MHINIYQYKQTHSHITQTNTDIKTQTKNITHAYNAQNIYQTQSHTRTQTQAHNHIKIYIKCKTHTHQHKLSYYICDALRSLSQWYIFEKT